MSSESANQYTTIVTMLIESYALDAIWTIAEAICYALATEGNPVMLLDIFNNGGDQVTVRIYIQRAPCVISLSETIDSRSLLSFS
jgi:hypothetical protein